jgi:hypothetical protein
VRNILLALCLGIFAGVAPFTLNPSNKTIKRSAQENKCYQHFKKNLKAKVTDVGDTIFTPVVKVYYTYVADYFVTKEIKSKSRPISAFEALYPNEIPCSDYERFKNKVERKLQEREMKTLKAKLKSLELRLQTVEYNIIMDE